MMIQRRAEDAGIKTKISCHSIPGPPVSPPTCRTAASWKWPRPWPARTTGLYDRRSDAVALDEVEKVVY
jgi:integrase/recombinase XerD